MKEWEHASSFCSSPMKRDLNLRCPSCDETGSICFLPGFWATQRVCCGFCGHELAVYGTIPDFASHVALKETHVGPAQRLMNSKIFALLYESPLWRPLHTRIGSGISMGAGSGRSIRTV